MPFNSGEYTRTKTFLNGGIVTVDELNEIQDDIGNYVAPQATMWKNFTTVMAQQVGLVNAIYVLSQQSLTFMTQNTAGSAQAALYFDPADFAVTGRTTQIRLRSVLISNAVAPGQSLISSFKPIATWFTTSGSTLGIATLTGGGIVASNHTSIGANTREVITSSTATAPAAGYHALSVFSPGSLTAGAAVTMILTLQYRQI